MKPLFKKADKMFENLGFRKIEENDLLVQYERFDNLRHYTQYVVINRKYRPSEGTSKALIQSYDPALFDSKKIGNTCVGLTVDEMLACIRKTKELGW